MEMVTAKVMPGLAARRFGPVGYQRKSKAGSQRSTKGTDRFVKTLVPFVVASSIFLCGGFAFLLFGEAFLIFLDPAFEIGRGLFELVAVQQAAAQRFEKRARANVVGEFFVSFLVRAFGDADEQFLVERCEPALDTTQTQRTLARDGPVGKSEREIVKRFRFKLSQQRALERVFERRIDHVCAVFEHGRDETQKAR